MNGPKHSLPESLAHQQGEGKDAESPTSLHGDTEVLRRLVNPKTWSEEGSAEHVDSDSQSPPVGVVGGDQATSGTDAARTKAITQRPWHEVPQQRPDCGREWYSDQMPISNAQTVRETSGNLDHLSEQPKAREKGRCLERDRVRTLTCRSPVSEVTVLCCAGK